MPARSRRSSRRSAVPPGVLALGGGALGSERVRSALRAHVVVLVEVARETAWLRASGRGRPLAADRASFDALYDERMPAYRAAANATLPSSELPILRRALPSLRALAGDALEGLTLLWATSASGDYPVWVGEGAIGAAPWPLPASSRRLGVSDANVADLHAGRVPDLAALIEVPAGETHKTLTTAERVWHALVEQGATRSDHVVAVGGGVVGDLAGFCAATYQRGIPHRAGADDARGAGRLGLRGQDRRRPARGQELRRRLPPARGGDRRSRGAGDAAGRRVRRRLRGGAEDGADRRRRRSGRRWPAAPPSTSG